MSIADMTRTPDPNLRGIDVSTYQGNVDWKTVAASGIRFAMIKATQGSPSASTVPLPFTDKCFIQNVHGASDAGISCGAYHYLTAETCVQAEREADYFLTAIKNLRHLLPLGAALDVEDRRLSRDREVLTAVVHAFCARVEAAGVPIMLYTNPDFLQYRLGDVSAYGLWLALWRDRTLLPDTDRYPNLRMWQWGSDTVPGVSGAVSCSLAMPRTLEPDEGDTAPEIPKPEEEKPEIPEPEEEKPHEPDYAGEVARLAGLSKTTMQYLSLYKWGDDLIHKLYLAMTNGQKEVRKP